MIYTDFMPDRFSGYTIGPIILIRPSKKDDLGLLAHEKVHVRQFWQTFPFFWMMFSKKFKLKIEVEAYREQLKYSVDREASARKFATFIATKYGLDVHPDLAYALLTEE